MDWVKPKHRARQLNQSETSEAEVSASTWLKQLCDENVAILQASLPVRGPKTKIKPAEVGVPEYLRATMWGTGIWEVENNSRQEYLNDLVELFGGSYGESTAAKTQRKRGKGKGHGKLMPSNVTDREAKDLLTASATRIGKWISQQLPKAGHDHYVALACAGWIHALPEVGRNIPPSLWLEVLQCALTQIDRAWENGPSDGLFPWIVWSCEVPLATRQYG